MVSRTKKAPPAEGISTNSTGYNTPEKGITPYTVRKLIKNIHYADNIQNIKIQVFPAPPEVWVEDADGETDPDRTKELREDFARVNGYAAMLLTYPGIMHWGCAVKSVGYEMDNGRYRVAEIRNLPCESFQMPMDGTIVNPLMPGITIVNGEPAVYQYIEDTGVTVKLDNYILIRDEATPYPSGSAYSMPVYKVVASVEFADLACQQQVNRIGAPIIMPKIIDDYNGDGSDINSWFKKFGNRWGKDTGFLIPQGVEFPDLKITESTSAVDYKQKCIDYIDLFFNPTSVYSNEGNVLSSSDSLKAEIWAAFIGGLQSIMEEWICKVFQAAFEWNGYTGYTVHIQLKRPSIDRSAERREQVRLGIEGKALTVDEIRDNLPDLDLKDMTPELKAELAETYKAAEPTGIFGNVTPGFTKKEDKEIRDIAKEFETVDERFDKKVLELLGVE